MLVETDTGELFPVTFYEPVRLAQDLEVSAQSGEPVLAETGMIVVPTLTPDAVELAARMLCEKGYFTHMRPITRADIEASHPFEWPPRRRM